MQGRLEDFNPGELIQVIGLLTKSGRLQVERADREGMIVFRGGRIIYAASSSVRENLGSLLLSRSLISEDELLQALEEKDKDPVTRRLGNVLVEMGVLSQEMLEEVIREQFSRIISGFIHWDAGTFDFECLELADHGEVEVDAEEFLVASGMESTHVLLDAARHADEREIQQHEGQESLDSLIEEIHSPTIAGETAYKLLDLMSEACGRCVLFAAYANDFQVVGHFGLDSGDGTATKRASRLVIPRQQASVLATAAARESPVLARLESLDGDAMILEALGGPSDSKSLALPVKVDGAVIIVLYGDQLSEGLSTGWIELLEIAVLDAVRTSLSAQRKPSAVS